MKNIMNIVLPILIILNLALAIQERDLTEILAWVTALFLSLTLTSTSRRAE